MTTNTQVLAFLIADEKFVPQDQFPNQDRVKSVSQHPRTGKIVYHQAAGENWWSDTIRFLEADSITLAEERLYKVRWDFPQDLLSF